MARGACDATTRSSKLAARLRHRLETKHQPKRVAAPAAPAAAPPSSAAPATAAEIEALRRQVDVAIKLAEKDVERVKEEKEEERLVRQSDQFSKQNRLLKQGDLWGSKNGNSSKANASTFVHKKDAAHNKRMAANVHHWGAGGGGSHYMMAGSKSVLKGNKAKGVVSRHSRQAAMRNGKAATHAKKDGSTSVMQ